MAKRITRQKFVKICLGYSGLALGLALGCGDSGDDDGGGDDGADGADGGIAECTVTVEEAGGHGHSLVIPEGDVNDKMPGTYEATGGGHTHEVVLSELDMEDLLAGMEVRVQTSTDANHKHIVTITCS